MSLTLPLMCFYSNDVTKLYAKNAQIYSQKKT